MRAALEGAAFIRDLPSELEGMSGRQHFSDSRGATGRASGPRSSPCLDMVVGGTVGPELARANLRELIVVSSSPAVVCRSGTRLTRRP